jgi:hypothetical protein
MGLELISRVSDIKPDSCLLNQFSTWRICKSLAWNVKLDFKAAHPIDGIVPPCSFKSSIMAAPNVAGRQYLQQE